MKAPIFSAYAKNPAQAAEVLTELEEIAAEEEYEAQRPPRDEWQYEGGPGVDYDPRC